MSTPFGSPLFSEDQDGFSFPIDQHQTNSNNNNPPLIEDHINPYDLPNTPIPISDYQDLSMFLDDYSLFGQLSSNSQDTNLNWVPQSDQLGLDQALQQDLEGSILGLHGMQHGPVTLPTTTIILANDNQAGAATAVLEIGEESPTKKLVHNAKERVRRMNLSATYSALRSLLPESRRAKKRWSAPYVIDRALDYIPQLQSEVDKLTLEKDKMVSVIGNNQLPITTSNDDQQGHEEDEQTTTLTVSINEVKAGEVIIQICERREKSGVLSNLIEKLEGEGLQVLGSSSVCAGEDRCCFHLHLQTSENPRGSDYVAVLHKKIISWLS